MKKFAFGFACVAAGCVLGAVVPTITAQAFPSNSSAPRWQQFCEVPPVGGLRQDSLVSSFNAALRARGAEGWEMAGFVPVRNEYMICYRRPAP